MRFQHQGLFLYTFFLNRSTRFLYLICCSSSFDSSTSTTPSFNPLSTVCQSILFFNVCINLKLPTVSLPEEKGTMTTRLVLRIVGELCLIFFFPFQVHWSQWPPASLDLEPLENCRKICCEHFFCNKIQINFANCEINIIM
jgi:hypothetical protein